MARKKLCKLCHERPATVPDRERANIGRMVNEICAECHAARIAGDFKALAKAEPPTDSERP